MIRSFADVSDRMMNRRPKCMRKAFLAALAGWIFLSLLVGSSPAHTETITLNCGDYGVFDLDFDSKIVTYIKGAYTGERGEIPILARTRLDRLTAEYVEWPDPFHPNTFRKRVERATGRLFSWMSGSGWSYNTECVRAERKPVF